MTNYYDGARAEEARLMGGFSPQPPQAPTTHLSDLLWALDMADEIDLSGSERRALQALIKGQLFGARVTLGEDVEDAEIIEEDEDW